MRQSEPPSAACTHCRGDDDQLQPARTRSGGQQRRHAALHVGWPAERPSHRSHGDGGGRQMAAQHEHSLEAWYAHIPGIRPTWWPSTCAPRWSAACSRPAISFDPGRAQGLIEGRHGRGRAPRHRDRPAQRHHDQRLLLMVATMDSASTIRHRGRAWPGLLQIELKDVGGDDLHHLHLPKNAPGRDRRRGLEDGRAGRRDQRADHGTGLRPPRLACGSACAGSKCRCRTRSISRKRRCRAPSASSRP